MRYRRMFLVLLLVSCGSPEQQMVESLSPRTVASADGVPIVFEVQGEGEPALVFVHGWAGYRQEWAPQMAHFSTNHRVIAIDLAGHGDSGDDRESWTMEAFGEDVAAVVDELGLTEVVLIGHSMGTPVILEAALKIPDKVVGLIPVDMLKNVEQAISTERVDGMVEEYMAGMANPTHESLGGWFTPRMDSTVVNQYVRYCQEKAQQHWVAWEQSLRAVFDWMSTRQTQVLSQIASPVVCINAARPGTNVEMARKHTQSFDVRIIEDVGHSVHWEAPEEFNQVLEGILAALRQ